VPAACAGHCADVPLARGAGHRATGQRATNRSSMRNPHRFIITIDAAQPPRYLLRRPAQLELRFNNCAQRRVQRELRELWPPRTIPGGRFSVLGAVARPPAIAVHLARDHGVAARDPDSDRPEALAASQAARDLLTLCLCQTTLRSLPYRRPNTTGQCHTQRNVLRPQTELASNRPRRKALRPQLPHTLLLALRQTTHHRVHHPHSPGSQASRPDVQMVRRSIETTRESSSAPAAASSAISARASAQSGACHDSTVGLDRARSPLPEVRMWTRGAADGRPGSPTESVARGDLKGASFGASASIKTPDRFHGPALPCPNLFICRGFPLELVGLEPTTSCMPCKRSPS
jgi:hypothetical protein